MKGFKTKLVYTILVTYKTLQFEELREGILYSMKGFKTKLLYTIMDLFIKTLQFEELCKGIQ